MIRNDNILDLQEYHGVMTNQDPLLHFFSPARELARVPTTSDGGVILAFRSAEARESQASACRRSVDERCSAEVRSVHAWRSQYWVAHSTFTLTRQQN